MPTVDDPNYTELSRLALDLWSKLYPNPPDWRLNRAGAQQALLFYRECFKAIVNEPFDATSLK
jgi:hypothetical protein